MVVRQNLIRMWYNWYPDLSAEKIRIGVQTPWEIQVCKARQLEKLTGVMGVAFGAGVKRRLRFGDGRVGVNIGDTLFVIDVNDGGDGDLLMMKYDVGPSALYVVMQFTHLVVSNIADLVAQCIMSSIKYSMM